MTDRDPIHEAYRRYYGRRSGWWLITLMSFDALLRLKR